MTPDAIVFTALGVSIGGLIVCLVRLVYLAEAKHEHEWYPVGVYRNGWEIVERCRDANCSARRVITGRRGQSVNGSVAR